MTIEVFAPAPIYDIQGMGPYAVDHPYSLGAIKVSVIEAGVVTALDPDDYSILPVSTETRGDVYLSAGAAAEHDGLRLLIERDTSDEQGWKGLRGERERGLEVQLDQIVMALQELRRGVSSSLRSTVALPPFDPIDGRALIIENGQVIAGPNAADIAQAQGHAASAHSDADRAEAAMGAALAAGNGRIFDSRAALLAAIVAGQMIEGQILSVRGVVAIMDASASGALSALHDLGRDGVRLLGRELRARWWTDDAEGADQAALMRAANTHALAVGDCRVVFEGPLQIGSQVDLGAADYGISFDFSAAYIDVIAGTLTPGTSAIIVRGLAGMHDGCMIDCHRLSSGWEFRNTTQGTCTNFHALHQNGHGIKIADSCANTSFVHPGAREWLNSEAEFADWNNFTSDGLVIDGKDCEIIGPTVGYCRRPIHLGPQANHVTIIDGHPYNGDPRTGMSREYPYIVTSEAGYDNDLFNFYLDNGMVLDTTGRLHLHNCRKYSNAAAVLPDHQVLVQVPDTGPDQLRALAVNCRTTFGFYNLDWMGSAATEPLVVLAAGQSNMNANADAVGGLEFVSSRVRIWGKDLQGNGSAAWISPAYGSVPLQLGGESLAVDFANRLAEMTGRMVYVILMARGGHNCESFISAATNAANGWTPTNAYAATMYAETAAAIAAVPGRTTAYPDFMVWHQGEANGSDSTATYQAKFSAMRTDAIAAGAIHSQRTRLIAGGLLEGVSHRATIEAAVRAEMNVSGQVRWAESDGLPAGNGSTVHFSGPAVRDLAWRYLWAGIEWANWNYSVADSANSADEVVGFGGRRTYLGVNDTDTTTYHEVMSGGSGAYIDWQFSAGSTLRVVVRWGSGQARFFDPATGYGFVGVATGGQAGIGTDGVSFPLVLRAGGTNRFRINGNGNLIPEADNAYSLGLAGSRISEVFAGTGAINTSDERQKREIADIPDAVLDAWADVDFRQYRWRTAVDAKGAAARTHFGLIAQHVHDAFAAHGLDAFDYGLLCFDQWEERPEILAEDGTVLTPYRAAGDSWGVRMDECEVLEMALTRRRLAALEAI